MKTPILLLSLAMLAPLAAQKKAPKPAAPAAEPAVKYAPKERPSTRLQQFLQTQAAGLPEAFRPQITQDSLTHASILSIAGHSVSVEPLVMFPYGGTGMAFAGMKLESRLDGKLAEQLSIKGLEYGATPEIASEKIYSHWWRVQAIPLLGYLLKNPPALTIGDVDIWTPVTTAAAPVAGAFPNTVENHKKLLTLAVKTMETLKPGEMYTAVASRQKQPPFSLARNWDGGWIVDEKAAKKAANVLPICNFRISTGADLSLSKAMEKLLATEKVKEEFSFGYILVKKGE